MRTIFFNGDNGVIVEYTDLHSSTARVLDFDVFDAAFFKPLYEEIYINLPPFIFCFP